MTNTISGLDGAHELLIKLVDQSPEDWEMRKKVAGVLHDAKYHRDASKMIWNAPEIPPAAEEIVFATKIVAKGQPTRAMRLVNTVIANNLGHPLENLKIAKLFVKASLPLQAIRFYGAAVALDASLVDEHFEIALIDTDIEGRNWVDEVENDEFPWEGPDPEPQTISKEDAEDAHAELLDGLTQPVPIKAQVRDVSLVDNKKAQEASAEPRPLPHWKLQEGHVTFNPKDHDKAEGESSVDDSKASSAKPDEDVIEPSEPQCAEKDLDVIEVKTSPVEGPIQKQPEATEVEEVEEVADQAQPEVDLARRQSEPAEESNKIVQSSENKQGQVSPDEMISPPKAAFFKSYDDAHKFKDKESSVEASDEAMIPEADATSLADEVPAESPVEAKHENLEHNGEGVVAEDTHKDEDDDISAYVAETMAEYEAPKKSENRISKSGLVANALASLVGKFRRPKMVVDEPAEEEVQTDEVALSADDAIEPSVEAEPRVAETLDQEPEKQESTPQVEPAQVKAEIKKPAPPAVPIAPEEVEIPQQIDESAAVKQKPTEPKPLYKNGVHTSAQKLVANVGKDVEQEVPKELDGRTQLVALAPEDGRPFFDQLKAKYQNVNPAELPMVARVARDMANADYLDLINRVCLADHKDLDAFSKLLGLHRAMTTAGCNDWVEDMNLLRKGYGDAVLATVVSRYSVSECREILNSIYQSPAMA